MQHDLAKPTWRDLESLVPQDSQFALQLGSGSQSAKWNEETAMTRGAAAHQHQLTWSLRIPFDWLTMNRLFTTFVLQLILVDQCQAIRNLRIASPLQALTIWDPEAKEEAASSRSRFLPRFKAGLEAEAKTRKKLAAKRQQRLQADATSSDWAKRAAAAERQTRESDERIIERAFDEAVQKYDALHEKAQKNPNENKYQFVGIVNPAGSSSSDKPITWYARKKPADANWSLRLIHVNKQAIVKDLFNRGKVDIFAKYENTGDRDPETNQPLVTSKYTVRERSWK